MAELLSVQKLTAGYEKMQILWDIQLTVAPGERVVILGANGAGKTTLLKTIIGLVRAWSGDISFAGTPIGGMRTDKRIRQGISYLSEIGIVPTLSIEDNLRLGAYHRPRAEVNRQMDRMYEAFPELRSRKKAAAGSLSGGQRKMVAVARALMSEPKLVMMDEPSAGLSPLFVNEVIEIIQKFATSDIAFMIAEQNVKFLDIADRAFVLDGGRIVFAGTVAELQCNDLIRQAYFGITG